MGNLRPEIKAANMARTINGTVKSDLWARAVDPEKDIKGVFCSITDPLGESRTIELQSASGEMYRTRFDQYIHSGIYHQVYYAKDNAGNVSLPKEVFVNVVNSVIPADSVPEPPELTITVEGSIVDISWDAVGEATGYALFYAPYPDAGDIGNIDMENQNSISFDGGDLAFYVAVQAYNGEGNSDFSNIEFFDLR